MSDQLYTLEPKQVWNFFFEICKIPHPSKKETAIIQYLTDFAKSRNLQFKTDTAGNLLVKKQGAKGYENKPTVVLQSHVDMVCEKNAGTQHNFETDPIQPWVDGDWVKAKGTTLGADNGMGVAAMLAVLDSQTLKHGPLECLFTVDEETGLTGAFGLEQGFFEGKILLNLDSEDEGTIFIGCAGGMTTIGTLPVQKGKPVDNLIVKKIEVKGLKGGHSGDDINKGLGNAIKILTRILFKLNKKTDLHLIDIQGGNLHNAIAREAWAIVAYSNEELEIVQSVIDTMNEYANAELKSTEKRVIIELNNVSYTGEALHYSLKKRIINLLYSMPHGVISMSKAIPGLVETSSNLASIKRKEDKFEITTSQRSDSNSLKKDIGNKVLATFRLAGVEAKQSEGYPGWKPNMDSPVLNITRNVYTELFKKEPVVTAIHAGLECGLFLAKYPGLDMVSFGPTIKGAHSPDERIEIASVDKFWKHLIAVLERIG